MSLPIRTTIDDIVQLCIYLAAKPIGATAADAKAVIDPAILDGRKVNAMKFWGLIEDGDAGRIKVTELGRAVAKNKGAHKTEPLRAVLHNVKPYITMLERAYRRKEKVVTASETAAHWHSNFKALVSDNEKIINDQAVCFFQVAQGADLGQLIIGRHGQPTRFEFHEGNLAEFIDGTPTPVQEIRLEDAEDADNASDQTGNVTPPEPTANVIGLPNAPVPPAPAVNKRVFITHGKNKKILDQVKEIVIYGGFEPVVAMERETAAKPVPEKVLDDMRNCSAAVIHVAVDEVIDGKDGKQYPQINGNVLIEIGAAMGLYRGYKFILLVEEGLKLPSNLQGLYECRYCGDELTASATMKLLKAFNEFKATA